MEKFTPAERNRLLFGLLLLAIAIYVQWWSSAHDSGDKSWLLAFSRMLVEGKPLYTGLFQPNLPLITWFYSGCVIVADASGVEDYHVIITATFAFIALSAGLCFRLMRAHPYFAEDRYRQFQQALLIGFLLIVWINPAYFADREHLIVVMLLPFLLRFMPSLAAQNIPNPMRGIIAGMAALALCVKPHAVVLIAAVQLILLLRERKLVVLFSLENIVIAVVLALYLLLIVTFTREYFSVVLPMLLAAYSETKQGITGLLPYCTSAFMLGLTLADFRLRYTSPLRRDILYFLMLCAACLVYALANNGWLYTFYPLQAMILLVTVWVFWEFQFLTREHEARGESGQAVRFGKTACALNIIFNVTLIFAVYSVVFLPQSVQDKIVVHSRLETEGLALLHDNHTESFGMMSASLSFWPAAIQKDHAKFETRFNHLWMLARFFTSDAAFALKNEWITAYVAHAYAEDLNHNQPQMMLVDASDEFYLTGKKIDLVEYFSAYPEFAQAWSHYRLFATLDHCSDENHKDLKHKGLCRYAVYTRIVEN